MSSSAPILTAGDRLQVGQVSVNFLDVTKQLVPGTAVINGPLYVGANLPVGVPRANTMLGPGIGIPGLPSLEVVGISNYYGIETKFSLSKILGVSIFSGLKVALGMGVANGVHLKNSLNLGNGPVVFNGPVNVTTIAGDLAGFNSIDAFFISAETISAETKNFIINHPSKPGYKLAHACIEGPENGVYYRGRLKKSNSIELPDYWEGLVNYRTITVHLTPRSHYQELYVKEVKDNKYVNIENNLDSIIDCDYIICAERIDVKKLVVEYTENGS